MGFVLLRLFAARLAFFRDDDDDDDVLRSDDMMMMMMEEKSGSRYDSSVSTFADVDVLFARSTKAARVLSLSLSLVLERGIQRVTHKRKVKKIIQSREIFFFFPKQTEEEEKEKRYYRAGLRGWWSRIFIRTISVNE